MSHKLTPKQARGVEALLTLPTVEQAADAAGVNPRTLQRWAQDPGFRAALSSAEGAAIDRAARRLVTLADLAIDALEDVLKHPAQKGATNKRLAAGTILEQIIKLRELRNVEQRLSDLEAIVHETHK